MAQVDWGGVALAITAGGAAVAVIINAFKTARKVDAVSTAVAATHDKVIEIDHAVNGKEVGAQSMVSQVDDLHKEIPPPEPVQTTGEALLPLVRLLVEDMKARRDKEQDG